MTNREPVYQFNSFTLLYPRGVSGNWRMAIPYIVLDLFPIQFPNGDEFRAGSIGVLLILFEFGLSAGITAFLIGFLVGCIKKYRSLLKINWFRYFATAGWQSLTL